MVNREVTRNAAMVFAKTFASMVERDLTGITSSDTIDARLRQAEEDSVGNVLLDLLMELYGREEV